MIQEIIAYSIVVLSFIFLIQTFFLKKNKSNKKSKSSSGKCGCSSCPIGK